MKGIILAGGLGTRLYPITLGTSKQLLPIYDKPMIYYPLSVLMLSGIRDILIISTSNDLPNFKRLLGNGHDLGLNLSYKEQQTPNGLAQAFIIGEDFIGSDDVCLVLGDNIFNGNGLVDLLEKSVSNVKEKNTSTIFGYYVSEPERYGVVQFDNHGKVLSIEEKPKKPKSNYAVVGLYFYTNSVIEIAKNIKPSNRGEFEITSVNQEYLRRGQLKVEQMGRDFAWLDTGTHESLIEASNYVKMIESRQGLKVACLEVIAYKMGYISINQLLKLAEPLKINGYGQYLIKKAKESK